MLKPEYIFLDEFSFLTDENDFLIKLNQIKEESNLAFDNSIQLKNFTKLKLEHQCFLETADYFLTEAGEETQTGVQKNNSRWSIVIMGILDNWYQWFRKSARDFFYKYHNNRMNTLRQKLSQYGTNFTFKEFKLLTYRENNRTSFRKNIIEVLGDLQRDANIVFPEITKVINSIKTSSNLEEVKSLIDNLKDNFNKIPSISNVLNLNKEDLNLSYKKDTFRNKENSIKVLINQRIFQSNEIPDKAQEVEGTFSNDNDLVNRTIKELDDNRIILENHFIKANDLVYTRFRECLNNFKSVNIPIAVKQEKVPGASETLEGQAMDKETAEEKKEKREEARIIEEKNDTMDRLSDMIRSLYSWYTTFLTHTFTCFNKVFADPLNIASEIVRNATSIQEQQQTQTQQ